MSLSQSKLGFHYYPDTLHFTQKDLAYWRPILADLGVAWLTLRASAERGVPEDFVAGLIDAGVQPIVSIQAPIGSLSPQDLGAILASYSRWGVSHVAVYDRPNLRASWAEGEWTRRGLVERFLDLMIPHLDAQAHAGLTPIFPALEPGGDYWDTAFLTTALKGMARRGRQDLLGKLALAAYAWTFDHPLTWGAGGPERWPDARPYHTPEASEDQRGFRAFEWYAQIAHQMAGISPQIVILAGGALRATPPSVETDQAHAEQNAAIARLVEEDPACGSLLANFAFFLLATAPEAPEQTSAWFPNLRGPLPAVAALRNRSNTEPIAPPPAAENKVLRHYVLLPNDRQLARKLWTKASDFALSHPNAVVGTSAETAVQAKQVTLAGGLEHFSAEFEARLRDSGCTVQRMSFWPGSQPCGCSDPAAEGAQAAPSSQE
jgi:hypothetical protein